MTAARKKRARATRGLGFSDVVQLARPLSGVEEGTSYGTPALKVKGKAFARLWEDGETLVLRTTFEARDHLITTKPTAFFLTEHYRDYPYVLVRLSVVTESVLAPLLADAWQVVAPKPRRTAR